MASRPDNLRTLAFALTLVATGSARAAEGWWSADAVSAQVPAFAAMQNVLPDRFAADQAAQRRAVALLDGLETALDALGPGAPPSARTYAARLRRDLARHAGVLEAFTTELIEDTEAAMTTAIERASQGRGWTPCEVRALPGMRRPSAAAVAQACPGTDQSAALAAELARDVGLSARLDALTARAWPALTLSKPETTISAVGPENAPWIAMPEYVLLLVSSPLEALDATDRDARLDLEARAEQEGSGSRDALRALDAQLDARLAAARASLAAPLLDALRTVSDRAPAPFALCPVPLGLGGCAGAPLPDDALISHMSDKRVVRAAQRANRLDPESLWP
jgi:hypothetical protein